jgi:hypothetical protein
MPALIVLRRSAPAESTATNVERSAAFKLSTSPPMDPVSVVTPFRTAATTEAPSRASSAGLDTLAVAPAVKARRVENFILARIPTSEDG